MVTQAIGVIDSISLENWKTHRKTELSFRKGTNVLVGVIGSGKSSVMDALCYGLYGTFPALQNRRVNSTDVLMRKPFVADTAKVEVCFTIGEKKYRVERILKRTGTNEGRLYCNDALLVGPKPSQVTERVEKELQVPYELFSRAVYAEQNQMDYFIKLNPAERKKKLDELLDLQKYEVVRSNVGQVHNQFRKLKENYSQNLKQFDALLEQTDVNDLRFRLETHRKKQADFTTQKEELSKKKESLALEKKSLEEKISEGEAIHSRLQGVISKQSFIGTKMNTLLAKIPNMVVQSTELLEEERVKLQNNLSQHISMKESFRKKEQVVLSAREKILWLGKQLSEKQHGLGNNSLDDISARQEKLLAEKKTLDHSLKEKQSLGEDALSTIKSCEAQLLVLEKESASLAGLHANCPTCKQTISPEHMVAVTQSTAEKKTILLAQKEEHHALWKKIIGEKRILESSISSLEKDIQSLEKNKVIFEELGKIIAEKEMHEKECVLLEKELAGMGAVPSDEEIERVRKELTLIDYRQEYASLSLENSTLTTEKNSLEKACETLPSLRKEWDTFLGVFSRVEGDLSSMEREGKLLEQVEKELVTRLEQVEKILSQREDIFEKHLHAGKVEETIGVFSTALVITQQQLRETVVEAINAALQEIWPQLYPYQDFAHARIHIEDNDYVLSLRERSGNWVAAESSLSGGERSAAALALRMAIAFVLTRQLSWIILDEPTHNLDVKSVNMLSSLLEDRLPRLVDQVFVITHSAEIEKAATGSLYVLEREKNEDGITNPVRKEINRGTIV